MQQKESLWIVVLSMAHGDTVARSFFSNEKSKKEQTNERTNDIQPPSSC